MLPDEFGRYCMEKGASPREPFMILDISPMGAASDGIFFDTSSERDQLVMSYGPFELRLAHKPRASHMQAGEVDFRNALLNAYQGRLVFTEEAGHFTS